MIFQSFSAVLLVAGGSGITHSLGIAHDLIRKASMPPYNVRARTIEIVWATKTQESMQGFLPIFHQLIAYAKMAERESPYGTTLKIHIYVTRQPANFPMRIVSDVPATDKLSPNVTGHDQFPPGAGYHQGQPSSGLRIVPGIRPNLGATLNEIVDSMTSSEPGVDAGHHTRRRKPQGIAVGVCGPDALVVDMRQAVRAALQSKGAAVGGIELLEESFSH
jgi:ferric-chelate reductase